MKTINRNMNRCYVIAEVGNTHEGSLGLAKQFIKSASECGVDAVKFQTHIFHEESLDNAPNPKYFSSETRKEYFTRTAFNIDEYIALKKYAQNECAVDFLSSPFSIAAVDMLIAAGITTLKIPSGEVTNIPMLKHISATGVNVILSSGMSTWEELDAAVSCFKDKSKLTILQCTSEYPCDPSNAGLNVMLEMSKRYNCKFGFSDHTLGIGVPLAAVSMGASVIEKHFTLSKMMYGSDAVNSTEPNEFKLLVKSIRELETSLASEVDKNEIAKDLGDMKVIFEKSIVASKRLNKGDIIDLNCLAYKKPGNGIPAKNYLEVLGKEARVAIEENSQITFEMLS